MLRTTLLHSFHGLTILTMACGQDPRDDEAASSGTGASGASGAADDTDGSDAGDDDAPGPDDGDSDASPKLDVGPGGGDSAGDDQTADECTNVDLLFVIDDSASMADNQQSLINSFPGFVAGMNERLEFADSIHIGVVTTSYNHANPADCRDVGSLVTQTAGFNASNAVCAPYASGLRYMDESEPDLAATFACAAQVGTQGSDDEMPIRAMLDALSPGTNIAGACNEGFARLDSLLVIVIITDEDDVPDQCIDDFQGCATYGSGGTPDEWHQQVLGLKANIPENVVVLSLLGRQLDNDCGAQPASKLIGFTNRFGDNGFLGDVCSPSYVEFFENALPVIDSACQDYVPPEG